MGTWTSKASKTNDEGFERPPPGNHLARLVGMFDLGTQRTEFNNVERWQHRVYFVWELLTEVMSGTKGVNHTIGIDLTFSLNEKAKMRRFIESRLGRAIPDGADYDISAELGQPCMLNVVQNGEYVKVDGVSALPRGMAVPNSQRTPIALSLEELRSGKEIPDWAPWIYGRAPAEILRECREMQEGPPPSSAAPPPAPPKSGSSLPTRPNTSPSPSSAYWLSLPGTDPQRVTVHRLKELVEKESLPLNTQVCPDGESQWKTIREIIPASKNWTTADNIPY